MKRLSVVSTVVVALGCLLTATTARAQAALPRRGADRVLRIPLEIGVKGNNSLVMNIEMRGGLPIVNGRADWLGAGFVPKGSYEVKSRDKGASAEKQTISLQGDSTPKVLLVLPADDRIAAVLWQLVTADEDARDDAELVSMNAVAVATFTREFGPIAMPERDTILRLLHKAGASSELRIEAFQGRRYAALEIGAVDSVFNDQKFSASARAARVATSFALPRARELKRLLRSAEVDGLALSFDVRHGDFVKSASLFAVEHWKVYLPSTAIQKLINAEITTQDLVDASVVLINQNRTKVVLTDG